MPETNQKSRSVENLGTFDFELDEAHMKKLDGLNEHYSSLGSLPYV